MASRAEHSILHLGIGDGRMDHRLLVARLVIAQGGVLLQRLPDAPIALFAVVQGGVAVEPQRRALESLSGELRAQFDTLSKNAEQNALSDRALADLYAVVGSIRGLVNAMTSTRNNSKNSRKKTPN